MLDDQMINAEALGPSTGETAQFVRIETYQVTGRRFYRSLWEVRHWVDNVGERPSDRSATPGADCRGVEARAGRASSGDDGSLFANQRVRNAPWCRGQQLPPAWSMMLSASDWE